MRFLGITKIKPHKELLIITQCKFDETQHIVSQIKKQYNRDNSSIVEGLTDEYGMMPVIEVCNLKISCPNCGSTEKQGNGKERLKIGMPQGKYICKECECEYRFPLVGQIKRIEKLISQPCRNCGEKDQFVLTTDEAGNWQLKCKKCEFVIFLHEYCDKHTVTNTRSAKNNKIAIKRKIDKKQSLLKLI